MENSRGQIADRGQHFSFASNRRPGFVFLRLEPAEGAAVEDDVTGDLHRAHRHCAVLRRGQVIRPDQRFGARVGAAQADRATADWAQIADRRGEPRKRVQRLTKLVGRQRLDVIFQVRGVQGRIAFHERA